MSGAERTELEPRNTKRYLPGVAARYAFAVACVALALVARIALDSLFHDYAPFFTFVVAVTAVAWFGGFGPALLGSALGFLAANWFFIYPRYSLRIESAGDALNAGSYFTVTLAIVLFSHAMHKARAQALSRQEEMASLAKFPSENPNPVLRLRMDGTILYANQASRLLAGEGGFTAGDAAPDFLHPVVEKARAGQAPAEVDVQRGARTWSLFVVPIPDSGYLNLYAKDVTERELAQQTLRESQADLNRAQAVARTGSWRLDVRRDELRWSAETYRIFGIPEQTPMTYEAFLAAVHVDDKAFVDRSWLAALQGEPYDIEHRIVVGDAVKWVRERAELEFDPQGTLLGGFGTVEDVTERKRAEQAREAQLERLAALTRVSEQVLAATTVEALLQQVVDAARELIDARVAVSGHGFENNQFRLGRASHSEDAPSCPKGELFTMERGGVYKPLLEGVPSIRLTEAELLAHPLWWGLPEGHAPLHGLLGARLVDATGGVNGMILVSGKREGEFTAEDETLLGQLAAVASLAMQHVEAHAEAVDEKNRLEAVLETLPVGMAILDSQGGTVRANSAFESIWGAPRPTTREVSDYAKFKAWWADSDRTVQPEEWASAQAVQHGRTVIGQLMRIEAFDGAHRFVLNSAAPIRNSAGGIAGCVVAVQDITEPKRAEERIVELYAQARQELMLRWQVEQELRRSNEDLSQFAFVISHDLRSPLNAVTSFARQLKEDYQDKLGEQADIYLSYLTGATDRMRRLISDLLAYSRVAGDGASQVAVASGEEALRSAELNLHDKILETKAVITHDPLPDVAANPSLLAQLFQNLLENALKFRGEQDPLIQVSAGRREEEWFFCVSDNGIGIEPEHLEDVFRIFKRLHGDKYEGTGIGLAMCKKIVERHGGRLWVESGFGKGARFCFTLPVRS